MNNIIIGFGLILIFILFSFPMIQINKVKEISQKGLKMIKKAIKQERRKVELGVRKMAGKSREVKLTTHFIYPEQETKIKPSFTSIEYDAANLQGWKSIRI